MVKLPMAARAPAAGGEGAEVPSAGTTIVACTYPGGVVLGTDGRVSTGTYVSNRASNKLAPLAEHVFLLRSGSAPDAQIVGDYVRHYVDILEAEMQGRPSVLTVANLVMQMNYSNKDTLVGALIIGGYDQQGGGQVYGCPIGGTLASEKWAIDGSGSTFIWGYCDEAYRDNFTREEAEAFVKEAVALAISSDSSSGGCMRLVTIDAEGTHHSYVRGDEVPYSEMPTPLAAAQAAGMVLG